MNLEALGDGWVAVENHHLRQMEVIQAIKAVPYETGLMLVRHFTDAVDVKEDRIPRQHKEKAPEQTSPDDANTDV